MFSYKTRSRLAIYECYMSIIRSKEALPKQAPAAKPWQYFMADDLLGELLYFNLVRAVFRQRLLTRC